MDLNFTGRADLVATIEAQRREIAELAVSPALQDVIAERSRQISAEGWTPEHDDEHQFGELAAAAACYAMPALPDEAFPTYPNGQPFAWPYDAEWWKPKGKRRDLVRAAALIVAEIERLDRAAIAGDKP